MKKQILWACTVVVALLMSACNEDDMFGSRNGNSVTFNVGVPELASTRAVGDGFTANKLYWGVYDHNNQLLQDISNTTDSKHKVFGGQNFQGSGTVTLTLAKDKQYSIIFWAANADSSMCTVDWEARTMTVAPQFANLEAYDAFCKYEVIDNVSGYMTRDIKLKRPFAQINIGTADFAKAAASGLTVQNTKVQIAGLHTTYDFVTGNSEDDATFGYDYPKTPVSFDGEKFPVEDSIYDYLSMNYALISADKKLVDVTFTYIDDDSQEHTRTYASVPVQRNWRTNIYGNILTSEADFKVTIVPEFMDEAVHPDSVHNIEVWDGKTVDAPVIDEANKTVTVATGNQLAWLAASVNGTLPVSTRAGETQPANSYNGWTILLDENIDLGGEEWTQIGGYGTHFEGSFDGQGHVISNFKITKKNINPAALFGSIAGKSDFKNFTVDSVQVLYPGVDAGDFYGAAVVGTVYGSHTFENINVTNSTIQGNNKVAGLIAHDGSSTSIKITNCHVSDCTIETKNEQDGGNVAGMFGYIQTNGVVIEKSSVKNCVINAINSSDEGKRANSQFVGAIHGGKALTIVDCVVEGNTFNEKGVVNYRSPYEKNFIGGAREAVTATVIINGKTYLTTAEALEVALNTKEGDVNVALACDITLPGRAKANEPTYSSKGNVSIDGNGFTLTFSDGYRTYVSNHGKLVFSNMNLYRATTNTDTHYHNNNMSFSGNVELNNVVLNKGIIVHDNMVMNNVTINKNQVNTYAMFVFIGANVVMDNCKIVTAEDRGRGIKVVDEDHKDDNATTTLKVSNTSFNTYEKAAILVKSHTATNITLDNIDIAKVREDTVNAVWIDEDAPEQYDIVTVTGGTKIVENHPIKMNGAYYKTIAAALEEAKSGDVIYVEGNAVIPASVTTSPAGAITFEGYGNNSILSFNSKAGGADGGLNSYADGMDLVFKNLKVISPNTGSPYSGGFGRAKSVTFEGCTYEGQYRSMSPVTFTGCTIAPMTSYIYTDYSDATFTGCTFKCSEGKGIQVYNDGNSTNTTINVENCTFTAEKVGNTWDGNPVTAIDINSDGEKFTVNITNTTAEGFGKGIFSNSQLWNIKGGEENVTVTIDNNLAYPFFTQDETTGEYNVTTTEGLRDVLEIAGAAGAGNTIINITSDIDLTGVEWTPIKVNGYEGADIVTVNGNGKTITGLTGGLFAGGFAGGSGIVIENLTIANSTIIANNTQGYGAFVGCADSMDKITLTNCHLINSSIITPNNGADESRIGGLIGWTAGYDNQNDGPVDSYITVKECSVTGCTLKGAGSIGGIVGHAGSNAATFTTIENCSVTNCELNSTDDGGWRVGVAVGTANVGEVTITNLTESGNTLTQTGKTAPIGEKRNYYGRFVPGTTGKLVIDGVPYVNNAANLKSAVAAGYTNICMLAGTYDTKDFQFMNKTLHLKGMEDGVKIYNSQNNDVACTSFDMCTVTFENLTIETLGGNYKGFARMNGTYKNCTIVNNYFTFYGKHLFENCTFNAPALTGSFQNEHCMWTYSAEEVDFVNCEFNYSDRCVNVYVDNGGNAPGIKSDVAFTNCVFNTANTASEGAVEVNSTPFTAGVKVALNGCTAPAYGEMVYVSPWDGKDGANATITVNGVTK